MNLSIEQAACVNSDAPVLIVKAFAGSGKTTMLRAYAEARPDERFLYIAFSKAVQESAATKFPRNVECRTTHSLAYKRFGRPFQDARKLRQPRPSDIMSAYELGAVRSKLVLETVESFVCSADFSIRPGHVPGGVAEEHREDVRRQASRLWDDMCNLDSRMPISADGYLKLFQLSKPDLSGQYDTILLDEEQDTNPATIDIVLRQDCCLVLVGDEHQSIFSFRRATIASAHVTDPEADVARLQLTHSFRFGEGIASTATALLAGFKGETIPVVGRGPTRVTKMTVDRSRPYAQISRTNAAIFRTAVALLDCKRLHFVGGADSLPFGKLLDVHALRQNQSAQVKDAFFNRMATFEALEEYAKRTDDKELLSLIGLAKEYEGRVPALVQRLRNEAVATANEADVIFCTAHRSKGLEFDQVVLSNDFADLVDERGKPRAMRTQDDKQEVNLLYVAITRALHAIELNTQAVDAIAAIRRANIKVPVAPSAEQLAAADAAAQTSLPTPASPKMPATEDLHTKQERGETCEAAATTSGQGSIGKAARELQVKVEAAILKSGLLMPDLIAGAISLPQRQTEELLAHMIVNGRLHGSLFKDSADVVSLVDSLRAKLDAVFI